MNREKAVILTDSGCDVPQNLRERYDIRVLPLKIIYPEDEYLDQVTNHGSTGLRPLPGNTQDLSSRWRDGSKCVGKGPGGRLRKSPDRLYFLRAFRNIFHDPQFVRGIRRHGNLRVGYPEYLYRQRDAGPFSRPLAGAGYQLARSFWMNFQSRFPIPRFFSAWIPWNIFAGAAVWALWPPLWEQL